MMKMAIIYILIVVAVDRDRDSDSDKDMNFITIIHLIALSVKRKIIHNIFCFRGIKIQLEICISYMLEILAHHASTLHKLLIKFIC
jgi:hypothetical protein